MGAVEEFDEGAGFTAFDGEQGLGVVLVVDAGLHHFLIDIEGVGDEFPFGGFGGGPVAALFDGKDGLVVAFDGDFPVLEGVAEVAEALSGSETV